MGSTLAEVGIALPRNETVFERLRVGRSQAYALVDRTQAALVGVTQLMGRPKKQAATAKSAFAPETNATPSPFDPGAG